MSDSRWKGRLLVTVIVNAGYIVIVVPDFLNFGGRCPIEVFLPLALLPIAWNAYVLFSIREWSEGIVGFLALLFSLVIGGMVAECMDWGGTLTTSKSKAKSNLGAIRGTQVAYVAEWSIYVGNQSPTPVLDRSGVSDNVKWDPTTRFSILGFAPEGRVYCSYSLEGPDYPTESQGFTARAHCDLDGDGEVSIYTITNASTEITHSGGMF